MGIIVRQDLGHSHAAEERNNLTSLSIEYLLADRQIAPGLGVAGMLR